MLEFRMNENREDFTIDDASRGDQLAILLQHQYGSCSAALDDPVFCMKLFEKLHRARRIHPRITGIDSIEN
jgi:hypothetical protein